MKIWFNHWFSTAYHLINLIRDDNPGEFTFIGTSTNPLAIYKNSCDEWYSEPSTVDPGEYVEFCLNFCQEHKVDVFVPRRFLVDIVNAAPLFQDIGVKLFANTAADIVKILDNKQSTYEFLQTKGIDCIPPIKIATSLQEFVDAYDALSPLASRVCYKLITDEGARSFRVIDDRICTSAGLLEKPGSKVTFSMAIEILSEYDFSIPMLLMPYLSGVEISVDCLETASGKIIIPRYKTSHRYSEVIFGKAVIKESEKIMNVLQLQMPYNIQYKMEGSELYLLEINPRMSGGLQLSCKASEINIPSIAMNKLLGRNIDWQCSERRAQKVAHIETPICLE